MFKILFRFLGSAFDFNRLAAVISAAGMTHFVWELRGIALRAVNKLWCLDAEVRPSLPGV